MRQFTIQSDLAIAPGEFWDGLCLELVNWELRPIVRMTAPAEWRQRPIEDWEVGRPLFKSWLLLLGCLPVDRHTMQLSKVLPGRGFREASTSWINRQWLHDRTVTAREGGCTVVDQVTVLGRIPILSTLLLPVYWGVFAHRHRRLRRRYGMPTR